MPIVMREYKVVSIVSQNEPVQVHAEGTRTKEVTTINLATAHEADETPESSMVIRTLSKEEMYAVGEEGSDTVTVRIGSMSMDDIPPTITGIGSDVIMTNTMEYQPLGGRGFVEGCMLYGIVGGGDRMAIPMERRSSNLLMFAVDSAEPASGQLVVVLPNGQESNLWPLEIVERT